MNPIIDKIRKLLRLGKDSAATPHEAALALAKAIKLAAENGIDLSQIPDDTGSHGGITHRTELSQAGLPHRLASKMVKRHFSVETLFDSTGKKPVIHFIGLSNNCDLAIYVYVFLVRSMRTAWRKRKNRRLRDRDSFLRGYCAAIDSLMPATFHQPGLILSADKYIETIIFAGRTGIKMSSIGTNSKKKLSTKAFYNGYIEGEKTGINNALRGSDTLNLD